MADDQNDADACSSDESAYLLASPENARRLTVAIDRLESGHGIAAPLAE